MVWLTSWQVENLRLDLSLPTRWLIAYGHATKGILLLLYLVLSFFFSLAPWCRNWLFVSAAHIYKHFRLFQNLVSLSKCAHLVSGLLWLRHTSQINRIDGFFSESSDCVLLPRLLSGSRSADSTAASPWVMDGKAQRLAFKFFLLSLRVLLGKSTVWWYLSWSGSALIACLLSFSFWSLSFIFWWYFLISDSSWASSAICLSLSWAIRSFFSFT